MYVELPEEGRTLGKGFWRAMVRDSVSLFKHTVPVAAAGATGGTSAMLVAGAGQAASLAKSKQKQTAIAEVETTQTDTEETNFLSSTSNSTLAIGGLTVAALVAALGRR